MSVFNLILAEGIQIDSNNGRGVAVSRPSVNGEVTSGSVDVKLVVDVTSVDRDTLVDASGVDTEILGHASGVDREILGHASGVDTEQERRTLLAHLHHTVTLLTSNGLSADEFNYWLINCPLMPGKLADYVKLVEDVLKHGLMVSAGTYGYKPVIDYLSTHSVVAKDLSQVVSELASGEHYEGSLWLQLAIKENRMASLVETLYASRQVISGTLYQPWALTISDQCHHAIQLLRSVFMDNTGLIIQPVLLDGMVTQSVLPDNLETQSVLPDNLVTQSVLPEMDSHHTSTIDVSVNNRLLFETPIVKPILSSAVFVINETLESSANQLNKDTPLVTSTAELQVEKVVSLIESKQNIKDLDLALEQHVEDNTSLPSNSSTESTVIGSESSSSCDSADTILASLSSVDGAIIASSVDGTHSPGQTLITDSVYQSPYTATQLSISDVGVANDSNARDNHETSHVTTSQSQEVKDSNRQLSQSAEGDEVNTVVSNTDLRLFEREISVEAIWKNRALDLDMLVYDHNYKLCIAKQSITDLKNVIQYMSVKMSEINAENKQLKHEVILLNQQMREKDVELMKLIVSLHMYRKVPDRGRQFLCRKYKKNEDESAGKRHVTDTYGANSVTPAVSHRVSVIEAPVVTAESVSDVTWHQWTIARDKKTGVVMTVPSPVRKRGIGFTTVASVAWQQPAIHSMTKTLPDLNRQSQPSGSCVKKSLKPSHCAFCSRKFRFFRRRRACGICGVVTCASCLHLKTDPRPLCINCKFSISFRVNKHNAAKAEYLNL
jgi:hypothetical protein